MSASNALGFIGGNAVEFEDAIFTGATYQTLKSVATSYTVADTDSVILVTVTAKTITLPDVDDQTVTAVGNPNSQAGRTIKIINGTLGGDVIIVASTTNIAPATGQIVGNLINSTTGIAAVAALTLTTGGSVVLVCTGAKWYVEAGGGLAATQAWS